MSKAATSNDNRRAEAVSASLPRSLIERAAEVYDFGAALRGGPRPVDVLEEKPLPFRGGASDRS